MTNSDEKKHEIIEIEPIRRVEAEVVDEQTEAGRGESRHENAYTRHEGVHVYQFGSFGSNIPLWKKVLWSVIGIAILGGILTLIGSFLLFALVSGILFFWFRRIFRSPLIALGAVVLVMWGFNQFKKDQTKPIDSNSHFGVPKND